MNEFSLTYIGIGTGVYHRERTIKNYTDEINQIFPWFLRKWLNENNGRLKIINYDFVFDKKEQQDFINEYFNSLNLEKIEDKWLSKDKRIEISIISKEITDEDRNEIIINLIKEIAIKQKNKFILQEYTGIEINPIFMKIYNSNMFSEIEKELIKKNALCDFTYGEACHCMTPMTKYEPLMIENDFLNLNCLSKEELIKLIKKDQKIDNLLINKFKKEYIELINIHHTNYRARIKGNCCMYNVSDYYKDTDPSNIMDFLLGKLYDIKFILSKLIEISEDIQNKQFKMMNNYYDYDVYEWYSFMKSVYKN